MTPDGSSAGGPWIAVAVLGKTRGNRGELTAVALSSKPERYASLQEVHLFGPGEADAGRFRVEHTWFHDGRLIFKFEGVDSIADAERLISSEVRIPVSERVSLDPGEYFHSELIGCEVIERSTGERLGRVASLDDSGAGGLLVLEDGMLIPFARAICVEIDPVARRIAVELPAGLKELNRP